METRDPTHLGTEAATTSTTTSPSEENGEPDPVNLNETMHYEGSGYGHNPVLYRPVSVFPHPAGYAVGYAPTVMPDQALFTLIHQNGNAIRIGHNLPVVYHSHGQIPAAYSLSPNAVQAGNIYHHEQLYGSLPPWNANYRIPGHGMVHHAARSHQIGGSLNSGYTHGWPGMSINLGIMHHTNPRANSLPSNFSVPQHHPQQHFPVPDGRLLSLEHHQHARLNHDSNRFIPEPTTGSRPLSRSHAGLSPSDLARFSGMSLTNTSLTRIPNKQHPFELQHGHENVSRVLPIVPPVVRPTVWTRESTNMQNPSGKSGQAQRNQLNRFNQTSVPHFWRNKKKTASSSSQFSSRKTQTWPSNRQYKPFRENVYHISRDGFETSCQLVGLNCSFCNGDLGYAPGNIESKPPRLPEVSVLSCGHAFHSECFQRDIHEQSADPSCYLCTLGRP